MSEKYLNGFNYAEYLKRKLYVGQIDPWRVDSDGHPFYTTLVPLETAIAECTEWSGQDINRKQFLSHLKDHNILVFSSIEDFVKHKKSRPEELTKPKKQLTEEQRKILSERMREINSKRKKNPS